MDSSSSDSDRSSTPAVSYDDFEESNTMSDEFGIYPYRFEPEKDVSNSESSNESTGSDDSDDEQENTRMTSSSW